MDNELREKLAIDINKLHYVAQGQADLAMEAGELFANAKAEAKQKKMTYEIIQAEVDRDIRANPDTYGLSKVTETVVKSTVVVDAAVRSALTELIEAEKESDLTSALVNAYQHRKSMIQAEVQLFVNNYWGDVSEKEMESSGGVAKQQIHDAKHDRKKREQHG